MFPLFSPKDFPQNVLQNFVKGLANMEHKVAIIRKWQAAIASGKAVNLKETQQDMFFLGDIFGEVLDYDYQSAEQWNLEVKPSTFIDATRPDAVLGLFTVGNETTPPYKFVKAVVELKEYKTTLDKKQRDRENKVTPVEQAFGYVPKFGGQCDWVIVSNIESIRLYHASDMLRCEEFKTAELLQNGNLHKFLFLLHKSRLFGQGEGTNPSFTDILYAERRAAEERITIEFYNAYRDIREVLFFSLCKTNPEKSQLAILTATQKLIDRLIFICFARDVIPMANVLGDMKDVAANIYFEQDDFLWELLRKTFRSYDRGFSAKIPLFNGGLFADDEFLNSLIIKDFQLLPLIEFLLKHDFQSDLNVTILGHIFEQSIADLEKLKEQVTLHNGQLEEEKLPSKRKVDGVFYTPDYITQYIVQHSVGAWLEEQKEILLEKYQNENTAYWQAYQEVLRNLRVLDPACGSGAFLVAVFNYLWVEWQIVLRELQTPSSTPTNMLLADGLSFENSKQSWQIRKAIIENNLFGVDLNMESVEITKLSLWILQANKTVPLSDLSPNIKQGNSLIDDKNITEWAFDWQQAFPFQFDVVVGNPPYVVSKHLNKAQLKYFQQHYKSAMYQINLYLLFIEKTLSLIKSTSYVSFIVPNTWLINQTLADFRKYLLDTVYINQITDLTKIKVFDDAVVLPVIFLFSHKFTDTIKIFDYVDETYRYKYSISLQDIKEDKNYLINYQTEPIYNNLFKKIIINTLPIGDIADVSFGVKFYQVDKGTPKQTRNIVDNQVFTHKKKYNNTCKMILEGKDVSRYTLNWGGLWIEYGEWLAEPRHQSLFEGERILVRRIVNERFSATYVNENYCNNSLLHTIKVNNSNFHTKYLLGLINSKLFAFYFIKKYARDEKVFPEIRVSELRELPIKDISLEEQMTIVTKVDAILSLSQKLNKIQNDFLELIESNFAKEKLSRKLEKWYELDWLGFKKELEKSKIKLTLPQQKQWKDFFKDEQPQAITLFFDIEKLDKEIDDLVYQLYNLTTEEIAWIENDN